MYQVSKEAIEACSSARGPSGRAAVLPLGKGVRPLSHKAKSLRSARTASRPKGSLVAHIVVAIRHWRAPWLRCDTNGERVRARSEKRISQMRRSKINTASLQRPAAIGEQRGWLIRHADLHLGQWCGQSIPCGLGYRLLSRPVGVKADEVGCLVTSVQNDAGQPVEVDRRDSFDVEPDWSDAGQRHANQVAGVRDRCVQMRAGQHRSAMRPAAAAAGAINDDVGRHAARQFGDGAAQHGRTQPLPYSVHCPDQPVRAPHFGRDENVIKVGV